MLTVLYIIPSLNKGGAERLVLDICTELHLKDDIEVKLITFSNTNKYQQLSNNIDWRVIPSYFTPSILGKETKNIRELQKFIDNYQPDIIHTHLWEAEMVCRQINYSKAKWFSHFHDNMSQLRKTTLPTSKKDITDVFERSLMLKKYKKYNNHFICISNHTFNYAKNVLPKSLHKNIHLLHNAIDFDHFHHPITFTKNTIKLINIGSFVAKKNQKLAIDIIQQLRQNNTDVELTFLGDGPLKKELMNYTQELNLSDFIHFEGNVDHVPRFLNQSTIYLHTATYEPFGLVLLEAMASGLPVVSLDGEGNQDIIENGVNGYIINEQNVTVFSKTIINLSKSQELYTQIALKGQEEAKKYEIKGYVDKLLGIYKN